ncbi:MAG: NAD(P)H-dependent oxidoreductase [Chloroflexi bacterium]|nr:NAD(P)H-dependent oxidoreductase [Chloroflexota bacterium]
MASPFRILAISGSLRRASFNRGLVRAARESTPEGVAIETAEVAALPHYDADVEEAGDPDAVTELKERIRAADALLIATPEYNSSLPGALKNAIDWASRPYGASVLAGKPAAVMGASAGGGGTARAQPTLKRVLTAAGCCVLMEPEVLVGGAHSRFDTDGNLEDDAVRDEIRALIAALVEFARQPSD